MTMKPLQRFLTAAAAMAMLAPLAGCKPDNMFFKVWNKADTPLHNIKLTFPGGEFDLDTLEASTISGSFHHFSGSGDLAISYATDSGRTYTQSGPHVTGNETGQFDVNIDGSDATFETKFDASQK